MTGFVSMTHELQAVVSTLHSKYAAVHRGEVATYIPELGKANPDQFGICLVTAEGEVFEAGDCDRVFTIQSVSKPFTFALALQELGPEKVSRFVGVEPSGDSFNSIALQPPGNRPHNPMINAGAITIAALLHGLHDDRTFDHVLERLSAVAGRRLTLDERVYESERRTGHRNRAIVHLLTNFGIVEVEAEAALDVYFKQCSVLVTCRDLAMMAATLSNMGRNPITGESALDLGCVRDTLSVMFTCGMYDYAGQWAHRVGMPAKSGVSGGVIAVVNRQLGIGMYSPRLDAHGNSCRGIEACAELSARLGLHVFDCLNAGSSFLHSVLRAGASS